MWVQHERVCIAALSGRWTFPTFRITLVLNEGLERKPFFLRKGALWYFQTGAADRTYVYLLNSSKFSSVYLRISSFLWWRKACHGTPKSLCSSRQASLHRESHTQLICWCWNLNQNTKSGWTPSSHLPPYLSIAAFVGLFNCLWNFSIETREASAPICSPNPSVYGCIWCMLNNDTDSLMWNPNKLSSRRSPRLLTKISSEERPRKVPASTAAPQVALRLVRFEGGMEVRCGTSDINERGQI